MLMSEEQSSEHEHEHEPEPEPEAPPPVRIEVYFNVDGKAVGPNANKYASRLGKLTRQHCPPHYSEWTLVPRQAINLLWNGILSRVRCPKGISGLQQLHKANNMWRNWKSSLRKHCDQYDTILERKRNRKSGVKKEEWDLFVDMESTELACLRRERGKENREMMKNPHTTGRRGSARTVEEMVFGKDGRGRVLGLGSGVSKTTLMAAAPYKRKAEEAERSKVEFQSQIDDLKQQVIDGKRTQMEIQSQVNAMLAMQGINEGAPTRISTNSPSDQGDNYFSFAVGRNRSNARYRLGSVEEVVTFPVGQIDCDESSVAVELNPAVFLYEGSFPHSPQFEIVDRKLQPFVSDFPIDSVGIKTFLRACLKGMALPHLIQQLLLERKSATNGITLAQTRVSCKAWGRVVAIGRMLGDREDVPENAYRIIVDEILEFNAELFGARGKTFSDIDMGSSITWPKAFTNVI
ncbi:hypothetical protein IFM89_011412 [Coptis chinensis]|uniref:Transposase n=1 Tax=Coptis chinensis TaxID=261450 RepID=A0A835HHG0_9MAGN|nr:hypothetical protein IFM89_011412 [Coptis chinensis]